MMLRKYSYLMIVSLAFLVTINVLADKGIIGIQYVIQNGYPLVKQVTPGYPAAKAGIRSGDWIMSVDGFSLQGLNYAAVSSRIGGSPNQTSSMVISRNGQRYTVRVTRVPPPLAATPQPLPQAGSSRGLFGFNFVMQSGYPLIKSTTPGFPAAKAGLLPGDWLMSIDGRSLQGQTFQSARTMMAGPPGRTSNFVISRNGQRFTLTMTRAAAGTVTTPARPLPTLPKQPINTYPAPSRPPRKPVYPTYSSDPRPGILGFKYEIEDNYPVIQRVFKKLPAARAGLEVGDKITAIDGVNMFSFNRQQVMNKMKGRVGQISLFTVMRNGRQFYAKLKRVPRKK